MKKLNILTALFIASLLLFAAFSGSAQSRVRDFYNTTYGTSYASDTTVNAGTGSITVQNQSAAQTTVIQVEVEEISGTGAGILTLWASLDGVDFKPAVVLQDTTTQVLYNTHTVTDVTTVQVFFWPIQFNPYLYYQIRHTGGTGGGMSYKLRAKILSQRQ